MLVDWFTTAAQIINFLVLMYLLKRFLYRPIIRAMDAREEKITASIEEARQKQVEAETEAEEYRKKGREIDEKRNELIDRARSEAESTRKELTEKARMEVEDLRGNWLRALELGKKAFLDDLKKRTTEHVFETVRKALSDLAAVKLEEYMTDIFIDQIKNLGNETVKEIQDTLRKTDSHVSISSAFVLPSGKRQHITREIHSSIAEGVEVEYEIEPGLITGIELKTPGRVVAWNLDEYLKSLERELSAIVSEETEKA